MIEDVTLEKARVSSKVQPSKRFGGKVMNHKPTAQGSFVFFGGKESIFPPELSELKIRFGSRLCESVSEEEEEEEERVGKTQPVGYGGVWQWRIRGRREGCAGRERFSRLPQEVFSIFFFFSLISIIFSNFESSNFHIRFWILNFFGERNRNSNETASD